VNYLFTPNLNGELRELQELSTRWWMTGKELPEADAARLRELISLRNGGVGQ
jgi:hypothetical protein